MKKQKFLALALAMSIAAGIVGTSSFVSLAAPSTWIHDASLVNYGTLTEAELAVVNQYFDEKFYAAKYEDVVKALGTDKALLKEHFIKCGIFEGREGWPTYRAEDFKSVELVDESQFVSVEIYAASNLMRTNDYATVQQAADSAVENGASIVNTDEVSYVVATEEVAEELAKNDKNYEKIGTLNVGRAGVCSILVYKKDNGYATKFLEGNCEKIHRDIVETVSSCSDIVGFIPVIGGAVSEINALCNSCDIETFEVETGTVIATEAAYYTLKDGIEFAGPVEFEAPYSKTITNCTDKGYAYTGVDVNRNGDVTYDVSTATEANEGNVDVTTVVSNDETGFNYTVTYRFDGNIDNSVAVDTTAEDTTDAVETTVEE